MATFINEHKNEVEDEDLVNFDEPEEVTQEVEQPAEEEIPDKYRDKDIKEVIRMHQEAEKLMGKQSSEVGELRKIVDDFVQVQLSKEKAHTSTDDEDEDVDFFTDPERAVERAIAKHPKIQEAETVTRQLKQQESLQRLKAAHPDFENIIKDQGFVDWVTKSKYRTEMLRAADRNYDFEAADELLTTWKDRQNMVTEAANTETVARKESLKRASTGNTKGSAEGPSRKVYRRADIIKLMQTDPTRYQALASEIRQAYAEGRVR